jgi:hypothetical protein
MEQTPVQKVLLFNQANQFSNLAEEYVSKGDFANACTAHFRAAEQFLLAMNDTKDQEVSYT